MYSTKLDSILHVIRSILSILVDDFFCIKKATFIIRSILIFLSDMKTEIERGLGILPQPALAR